MNININSFENMKKRISKVAYGSAITLEAIICFVKSHTAADFMYYICRVFGIALPLPVAIAIRILLLTTGGHALIDGIKKLCPELHHKLFARG